MEQVLLVDNLAEHVYDFLIAEGCCADVTATQWTRFFEKADEWKAQFLLVSGSVNLAGIDGWEMDIYFNEFLFTNSIKEHYGQYLYKIMLVAWTLSFPWVERTIYLNINDNENLLTRLKSELCLSKTKGVCLSKKAFISELEERYTKSKSKPECIHYENQYQKFLVHFESFKLLTDYSVVRLNNFGLQETVWYFIQYEAGKVSLILINDFL